MDESMDVDVDEPQMTEKAARRAAKEKKRAADEEQRVAMDGQRAVIQSFAMAGNTNRFENICLHFAEQLNRMI